MDLSHSRRHLPGRLALLVLRDGDKTPVWAPIGGERGGGGRAEEVGKGFPETPRCWAINLPVPTVSDDDEAPSWTQWVVD